jgi:hypothetical protein
MVGAGGSAGASLTGEEVVGAVLEGEVAVAFFFFSGAVGTRFRPPGIFGADAHVASAGVFIVWR